MGSPNISYPNSVIGYRDPATNSMVGVMTMDNQSFDYISGGPGSQGPLPDGQYSFESEEKLVGDEKDSMTDDPKNSESYSKFRIVGKGPRDGGRIRTWGDWWHGRKGRPLINDPSVPSGQREGLLGHCDGRALGTDGCVGYRDCLNAQAAIENSVANGNPDFFVKTVSKEEVMRLRAERMGRPLWEQPETPGANQSKVAKHGAPFCKGSFTTRIGVDQRELLKLGSPHEAGGVVTEGKKDIVVDPTQDPVAGVGHRTSDPSTVKDGETSVQMGK